MSAAMGFEQPLIEDSLFGEYRVVEGAGDGPDTDCLCMCSCRTSSVKVANSDLNAATFLAAK